MLGETDFSAIILTLKLAAITTIILLLIGTPIAWWLARSQAWWKGVVSAIVMLPIVLPPTVIGFYLLLAMGSQGWIGHITQALGLGLLPFTFAGLVIASVFYSLPFVVQPLQNAFESIGQRPLEVAATLRASPFDTFFSVILPLAKPAYLTASVLAFAHTMGEFGVVLMVGGNIPGQTRVISVALYEAVEGLDYGAAHRLAGLLMVLSFAVLLGLYGLNAQTGRGRAK